MIQTPLLGGIGERADAIPEHPDCPPLGGQHQLRKRVRVEWDENRRRDHPDIGERRGLCGVQLEAIRAATQQPRRSRVGETAGHTAPRHEHVEIAVTIRIRHSDRADIRMVRRGQLDHLRLGFARPKNLQRRNHRFREIVCGDGGEQRAFTGGIHPAGEAKRVTQQRLSKSRLVKLGQAAIGSGFVGSDVAPGAGAKEQFVRTITIPVEHHDARAGLGQSPSEHWLALKVVGRRLGVDVGQPIASIGKQRRGCGRRPGLGLRVFLVNLVSMIRLGSVDDRACPAWPGDLDAELTGLASGKRP